MEIGTTEKEFVKQVLEDFPVIRECIYTSNWDKMWDKLYEIDDYYEESKRAEGIDVFLSELFYIVLTEAGVNFKIREIPSAMFYENEYIDTMVLPEGLEKIYGTAFAFSSLKKIELPDTLKEIRDYAFSHTELEELVIPKSVNNLGWNILNECHNIKKVMVSKNIKMSLQQLKAHFGVPEEIIKYY